MSILMFVFVICLIGQYLFIGHYFVDLYVIPVVPLVLSVQSLIKKVLY